MSSFKVQRRMCATCIYRPDSYLDLGKLENEVRDPHMGFSGHRVCHHAPDKSGICCRGFWDAHKDEFPAGQIAQRLNRVEFVEIDTHSVNDGIRRTRAANRLKAQRIFQANAEAKLVRERLRRR